jgi:hypothetical protein
MSLRTLSLKSVQIRSGLILAAIIIVALLAFEIFNYSTTEYALSDLLGSLLFAGVHWSTILSIAFCGIDFAGIARLFTPEVSSKESKEAWYLFGAWLLAATMNALLTWWGVSMAIVNHPVRSVAVVDSSTLTHIVPVFVAVMVLVIRILIIGTISMAVGRSIPAETRRSAPAWSGPAPANRPSLNRVSQSIRPTTTSSVPARSFPDESEDESFGSPSRLEPTYTPLMARSTAEIKSGPAEPAARPGGRKF